MAGVQVRVAVLTNFTQDHLDYHGSMQSYWLAKRKLFEMNGLAAAVINLDDPKGAELLAFCEDRGIEAISTGLACTNVRLRASECAYENDALQFVLSEGANRQQVLCPSAGMYNVANMLSVVGALRALGVSFEQACAALSHCTPVPGRMQCIRMPEQPLVVVDYAHTPDALMQALRALRPWADARGGRLLCVFGCGGNRDATKRALMAQAAQRHADSICVTSDNPRFEQPGDIAEQVLAGFEGDVRKTVALELDRALAIARTIGAARPDDVILIAGKGHEEYQDVAGVRHPFSDQQQAQQALKQRAQGGNQV